MSEPWHAACPACREPLGPLAVNGLPLTCRRCGSAYACRDGIWRFLLADDADALAPFLADYRTVRQAEGRGSDDPAYYRRLPATDPADPLAWQWRIRAGSWRFVTRRHLGPGGRRLRVADLGAGVGWLANRAVALGHDAIAVDLDDDERDGLGAGRHLEAAFPRAQATFDRLPLAAGQADLVVYNASFHYTTDPVGTLAEGLRLLRPGGAVLVIDSPIYRRDASGRRMASERHADFEARFGTRSDRLGSIEYLTDDLLARLADELGLVWRRGRPWYGWRWAVRPVVARARRQREPSRFHVLEARLRQGVAASGPRPPRPGTGNTLTDVADVPCDQRLRRTWLQRLVLVVGVLATMASLLTAAGVSFVRGKVVQVQRVSLGVALSAPLPPEARLAGDSGEDAASGEDGEHGGDGDAVNILVVGVDNADGLAADDRRRVDRDDGKRSDTIMLVRLDPATGLAVALSFPRDLWLPLGGDGGRDRINAALPLGGPELLVRTVTANFGVRVDHYLEVDFAQFRRLVDVVGGVPMPFDRPVRDDNSGLYVGEPGCVVLDGDQALDYVRSRYLQYFQDGEWHADGFSDLSRIRRQQDFMRRALQRAQSKGLSNPFTANRLIDVGLDAVTVDSGFSVSDMVSLARRFRSLDPASLLTFSLPTAPFETAGGAAVLGLVAPDAEPVLDIFRGFDPDSPGAVHVTVDDATVAQALQGKGFATEVTAPSGPRPARTTIRYQRLDRYRAESLARWLGADADLVADDGLAAPGVTLDVGADIGSVLEQPRPAPSYWKAPTPAVGVVPGEGRDDICS